MSTITSEEAAQAAEYFKQWMIGTNKKSGFVYPKARFEDEPDRTYNIKNGQVRKFLQHEKQKVGINLGWTDDAEPATGVKVARWFFTRKGSDPGPIKYGETIALGNGGDPSFIRYKERTLGINLDWSETPVYEWQIFGGPAGEPVEVRKYLAVYNTQSEANGTRGEFFIYFDRSAGGDIGWPSSETWDDVLGRIGKKLAEKAAREAIKAALAS